MGEDWFLCVKVNLYEFLDCCVSARNLVHDTNTIAAECFYKQTKHMRLRPFVSRL